MFTFSSLFSPQVNCVYSTLKGLWAVSLWTHVGAECIHSFTCTALAFTSAHSMFSRSAPAKAPSALQLQGLLTHQNLTAWVSQGDFIIQPTLTWTSLSCIPMEGTPWAFNDQAFQQSLLAWKKQNTYFPLLRMRASEETCLQNLSKVTSW